MSTPSNRLGLTGLPPLGSSPRAREVPIASQEIPTVNVQAPSSLGIAAGERARPTLGSSASEPQGLGTLSHTFPRRTPSVHSSPDPSEQRKSTDSNSPHRFGRVFDSPKLRGIKESLSKNATKIIHTPASDPGPMATGHSNHLRSSPRWPLPGLHLLHMTHSRQEPFLPQDPYAVRFKDLINRKVNSNHWIEHAGREVVLLLMLRLPATYFSRVARVFRTAELSKAEVDAMIQQRTNGAAFPREWNETTASKAVLRFRTAWEDFLRSLEKEWKTLNIVSALLTTGIISLFQIPDASSDIVTRTFALLSMVCAVMSLIYGCTFILRFSTMRGIHKAIKWAEYMQSSLTNSILWNVWVLLATPAIWLAYSMIAFSVAILAFVWTTGTDKANEPPSTETALAPRILVTAVFVLGVLVYIAVIQTFGAWTDDVVYVRNLNDHFDSLENGHPDIELGNALANEERTTREGELT